MLDDSGFYGSPSLFVCLFVRALDIASKMDHPIFQGFSLEPKVFGVGNTPSTR